MEGSQHYKSRSRDPFSDPLWRNFAFFVSGPGGQSICTPNLKFLAQNVAEIWRGSQNFKSRPRDPFPTLFDIILHFFRQCPWWSICMPKFEVSSTNRTRHMEGVPKFQELRSRDTFPTPCDLFFHCYRQCPRWSICKPNLKILSIVPEIWRGSQNFKSRSHNPFPTLFDLFLHFYH